MNYYVKGYVLVKLYVCDIISEKHILSRKKNLWLSVLSSPTVAQDMRKMPISLLPVSLLFTLYLQVME